MDSNYAQVLSIQKNGVDQCVSFGYPYLGDPDKESPSCAAVMELLPQDEVYVVSNAGYPVGFGQFTGFTGFLIRPYV